MSLERERQLCASWFQDGLTDDDRAWLREQIELSGQQVSTVDVSWVTTTDDFVGRMPGWLLITVLVVLVAFVVVGPLAMWGGR